MKTIRVSKIQYDDFLYPAVAANRDSSVQELRLTAKVLDILETAGVHPGTQNGRPVEMGFKLRQPEATFEFEDRQAEHVAIKLEAMIPNVQAWRAREMLPLLDQLRAE